MNDYEREEFESHLATPGEAAREYGRNAGMDNPDNAWILTPWDSWERNPFYSGPEVPHPEINDPLDDDRDQENPSEYSEGYDWGKHDWDNDPDWR